MQREPHPRVSPGRPGPKGLRVITPRVPRPAGVAGSDRGVSSLPRLRPRVHTPSQAGYASATVGPIRLHPAYVPFFRVILIGFLVLTAAGGLLLTLPFASASGDFTPAPDAFFTAVSAISATGLATVDTHDSYSRTGVIVIMSLIQLGGIGFMTMSAFVLLLVKERVNVSDERIADTLGTASRRRFVWFAVAVVAVTLLIEALGAYLFYERFAASGHAHGLLDSSFYSISAFNNAGFDLEGGFASVQGFQGDLALLGILQGLFVIGGLGVPLVVLLCTRPPWLGWSLDAKLTVLSTIVLLAGGAAVIGGLEWSGALRAAGAPAEDGLANAAFLSGAARTAGFSPIDLGAVAVPALLVIMLLMFIGGASGSTAGGVKVNTFATVALTAFSYVRGRHRVHAFGKTIPEVQVHRAVAIVFFTAALVFAIALALSAIEGFDFTKLLFESVSAVSTTGYTSGVTPDLSLVGKGLIMFGMFAGRIGPLTLALALSARSVETREAPRHDEAIRVG